MNGWAMTLNGLVSVVLAGLDGIGIEKAVGLGAALIFVGAFILQFFSIYRHRGRDAVVSMMTWVLVACLCMTVAGYYWQQQRDFFQVVLLLFLAGGALSCFMLSAMSRQTLAEESARRKGESIVPSEREAQAEQLAADIRARFADARRRKTA